MDIEPVTSLGKSEIADLSSRYIDEGVKVDAWEIRNINISGKLLKAEIGMVSYFVSPTDPDGFHLTIFSTQEFLAQLANIYLHVAADFKTKCRETWMRECAITSRKVIRNPEKILVEMDFFSLKKIQDTVVSMARCRVYDDQGGLVHGEDKRLAALGDPRGACVLLSSFIYRLENQTGSAIRVHSLSRSYVFHA